MTHLSAILDPSHATGKSSLVPALSRAGVAIGADGLIVEVHPRPGKGHQRWRAHSAIPKNDEGSGAVHSVVERIEEERSDGSSGLAGKEKERKR